MMADIDSVRRRYIKERPKYELIAQTVANRIRDGAVSKNLNCNVTFRAKRVESFVKKCVMRDYADPWRDISDKAGVRIIVSHSGDLDIAFNLVRELFGEPVWYSDYRELDDIEHELRYPRLHMQVVSPPLPDGTTLPDPAECEVQIRTEALDLWARMSHSLLYKPQAELPKNVRRSLYRLLALIELYDQEVERAVVAMQEDPDRDLHSIMAQSERLFHIFCTAPYNADLSREVLRVVLSTLRPEEVPGYCSELRGFADLHKVRLENIFRDYGPNSKSGASGTYLLATQPESIPIFERLENAPMLFRAKWIEYMGNDDLLDDMRSIWG
jgi:Uncharacterized protein conserved in bacteria